MLDKIRNFCIIAHIDHGKSTLSDRLLEITGTISKREMKEQLLDSMDLERERGITIKLQPARMEYKLNDETYYLNLIDTPGHVDFNYEVSRSLAAVEGAILLVDATQGVQAQTLANLYLAIEQDLTIIPVINKIDLPASNVEKVSDEIIGLLGCDKNDIILTSAKTGKGVDVLLEEIVKKIPCPKQEKIKEFRSLIFDSNFDEYKGVICYVRVYDGEIKIGDKVKFMATDAESEVIDVGFLVPKLKKTKILKKGEIGYIITGIKEIEKCRVGDTLAESKLDKKLSLPGYKEVIPMVYAGIFCQSGEDYGNLREAIQKLKLNDSALQFEPEHSKALGFGFRCGFLGLLHLEIFQERISREYDLDLVVTVPSVAYYINLKVESKTIPDIKKENIINDKKIIITSAIDYPDPGVIESIEEPIMRVDIIAPEEYIGAIMSLTSEKRGNYLNTEYLTDKSGSNKRAILHYRMPLATIIVDFYDKLKSVSSGYASLFYEYAGYERADVIKLDIMVAEDRIEALSFLTYKDDAFHVGKRIVKKLKEVLPRQMFEVKLQASIGSKVIASERLSAFRKDVTAKLYGGDHTRKMKLLKKQKAGKKKMKEFGKVKIPSKVFLEILKK